MQTGDRLRLARRRLRMTQRDLAGEEFHRSLISQIETGLIEPSLQTLTVLADRVGLPASFFIQSPGEELRAEAAVSEARTLIGQNAYEAAYHRLLDALPLVGNFRDQARLLLHIGDILILAQRSGEALGFLETAQRYLRCDEDASGLIEALLQTGRAQAHMKRYRAAIESYSEALRLTERFITPKSRVERQALTARQVRLTLNIGKNWVRLKEYDAGLEWLQNALSLASESGLYEDMGLAHQSIAIVHKQCGRFHEAEHHNRIALSCFDENDHALNRAICLSNMGGASIANDKPNDAIPVYFEALSVADDDPRLQVMVFAGLASAYLLLEEYDQATEWIKKAITIFLEQPPGFNNVSHSDELPEVFLLLAQIYQEQSRQRDAYQALRNGLQWYRSQQLGGASDPAGDLNLLHK